VRILGTDFEEGLREHTGLSRAVLPRCLGGETPDDQVCPCEIVPVGAAEALARGGGGGAAGDAAQS